MTIQELKKKASSRYESTLKKVLLGEDPFPVLIPYKRPRRGGDPGEILHVKQMLKSQSKEKVGFGPIIQFEEANTRRYGVATMPGAISFDTLEDLTRYIGKKAEAGRFSEHAKIVTCIFPGNSGINCNSSPALVSRRCYNRLGITKAVSFFIKTPKPWVYPRELPLGLHTKFLEQNHRPVIEVLAQVSPMSLNETYTNWQDRLGLRSSSQLVEGRFLDDALAPHLPQHMLAPVKEWNRCAFIAPTWVLITENRTTLLTLPRLPGCLALLGKGYAVTRLSQIKKLHTTQLYYWGDIDQHGFEILASIRSHLPKTLSFLMDEQTLAQCQDRVGIENVKPTLRADFVAAHLTPTEKTLWIKCVESHLRLEQEWIPREVAIHALNILAMIPKAN